MDKKELRAQIRAKKRAMTSAQVEACSEKLAELFRAHPLYKAAKSIYGYMPYNQEVRTIPIMRQAQADGKRVAVPKVYGDTMKFLWLDDLSAVLILFCAAAAAAIDRRPAGREFAFDCHCVSSPVPF